MYEVIRNIRQFPNLKVVTYTRNVKEGAAELEVEAGCKVSYQADNYANYFSIRNKNPRAIPMIINTYGENGSEGFEVFMNTKCSSTTLIIIALKFIRRVIIDSIKGKIY